MNHIALKQSIQHLPITIGGSPEKTEPQFEVFRNIDGTDVYHVSNCTFFPRIENTELSNRRTQRVGEIFTEEQIYIEPQGYYSIEDGLKFWSQFHPYVGLHYHISQYMELGTVEGISSYSFANEVEEVMNKFYDIPATETSASVTNFKIVDVKNGLFLCQCKDTGIFFIAEDFSTLISKYEDYILEELYDLGEDITIKDITDEMLINIGFSLDMDFFTVERYDNIDNARKQVKELLK